MGGCQLVEPKEVAATVYKYQYVPACVCCDKLGVRVRSTMYRTRNVPEPFVTDSFVVNKDSLNVWIRYKDDDSECGRITNDLVVITSMRLR